MSFRISTLIVLIAFISACGTTGKKKSWSESLVDVSTLVNKTLPKMIDEETRLDSTNVSENTFIYNYTMINFYANELDIEKFKTLAEKKTRQRLCTNPKMKSFIRNKTIIRNTYNDKDNNLIASVEIDSATC